MFGVQIKRQEQEAIKRIRQNPVQMERIKKEVSILFDSLSLYLWCSLVGEKG